MFSAIIRIPVSFLTLSIPRNINRLKPKEAFIIISKVLKINRELPHITPHGFRYTHTSILIESATEINEIQERLGGHASISITGDTHGHLTEKAKENTANKFAEALNL